MCCATVYHIILYIISCCLLLCCVGTANKSARARPGKSGEAYAEEIAERMHSDPSASVRLAAAEAAIAVAITRLSILRSDCWNPPSSGPPYPGSDLCLSGGVACLTLLV